VAADLDAMPKAKAWTQWHLDRVREAEWLTGSIERCESMLRERALLN
jgi:hypothetical protein